MKELNFGHLDRRQLCLRFSMPYSWRAAFARYGWAFSATLFRHGQHRCYCPGTLFDGRLCVAGFGVTWWYSCYGGPVPCSCDEVVAEWERERELAPVEKGN